MNGVNLIDFVMPSPIPTAGAKRQPTRVGGFKLSLSKKEETRPEELFNDFEPEGKGGKKMEWGRLIGALLALLGVYLVIKIGTWMARRGGK